jgi:large-conductance mechanosensitive channel
LGLTIGRVDAFVRRRQPLIGQHRVPNSTTSHLYGPQGTKTVDISRLVLTQIISLDIVGLVLFMCLKAYNKIRKPVEAAPPGPNEIDLLTQIRDELRTRS